MKQNGFIRTFCSVFVFLCVLYAVCPMLGAVPVSAAQTDGIGDIRLIPGGVPFGVRLYSEGVLVVGVGDVECSGRTVSPAGDAGILEKDIIYAVDGQKVTEASELSELLNSGGGASVELSVKRADKMLTLSVTPVLSDADGKYKTGLFIKDSTAGIGTVTYIDPRYGSFAGLGHGICDSETGELVPLTRGTVVNVEISGVVKGQAGAPGELKGYFSSGKIGTLFENKSCGVFGVFAQYPVGIGRDAVPIASASEVKAGEAELLCTTDNGGVCSYRVKISDVDRSGRSVKNFVVTVTDEALLSKTGGIVQGMSGSPLLQDGKLIGAVTHVLVNNPTTGYGIFIENMLDAAS